MAESLPRTTVLVVGYRHALWIEQCLDSCLAQTRPVRLVVVDDASDDDTEGVLSDWCTRTGAEVRTVVHRENVGLGPSLVEGLGLVDTELVAYLAADDWLEPDRVAAQEAAFDDAGPGCVLVYSDCFRADAEGRRLDGLFSEGLGPGWKPRAEHAFGDLLEENWIPAPSVMVRTDALRSVGGYDPELFYEDYDTYLRLARAGSFRCVERPLATHRELTSSLGHRMFFAPETRDERDRATIRIYLKHLGSCGDRDALVAERVAVRAVRLWREGEHARTVAGWLARTTPFLRSHRTRFRVFAALAALGVPGRRVPGGRG